jgi:hypothetical protein
VRGCVVHGAHYREDPVLVPLQVARVVLPRKDL